MTDTIMTIPVRAARARRDDYPLQRHAVLDKSRSIMQDSAVCGEPAAGGQLLVYVAIGAENGGEPDAAKELSQALDQAVGATRLPIPKGGPETLLLALGSAGAISAAVDVFRLWISRERRRRLVVTWTVGEQEARIELTGDQISDAAARDVLVAALKKSRPS